MNFEVAVVKDIVLNDTSKYFTNVGEWNGIGTVYFKKVKGNNYKSEGFAKPYFSNFSNYPLLEELVYIFSLPSPDIQTNNFKEIYYYITPLNIWNSNHHNGIPNIFENKNLPDSQKRDYVQTQAGAVRRVEDGSSDINLGQTFKERSNIKPVKKFEGDVVLEGRLGNSIRLGSTNQIDSAPLNNWSELGYSGDPILILRNGQGDTGSVGFLPTEENINQDPSSIYLTSTQKIPFQVASSNYLSYKGDTPTLPNQYSGKQILINSGRLIFNSSEDHLLLSSKKSISLNSITGLNIDTNKVTFQTEYIYLGSKSATEPLVLGDALEAVIKELISIIQDIAVQSAVAANSGGPIPTLNQKAPGWINRLTTINTSIFKSKYNFTV
jgi:hypothetical protein